MTSKTRPIGEMKRRAAVASVLMVSAALGSFALVPTKRLSQSRPAFNLHDVVPLTFRDWQIDPHVAGIINPQTQALLDKTYSQVFNRTYVNPAGQRIMLSIAYSADQSDVSTQVHFPEVCYPAQGFQIHRIANAMVSIENQQIPVKRLETSLGNARFEPVTYWVLLGDFPTTNAWDRRWAEMRHGLHGEIADGMLVRVSSISTDTRAAYELQDRFTVDLKASMRPADRHLLFGRSQGG